MVAKMRHFVPLSVLQNIYISSSLPHITYVLVAWDNASKNYINKVVFLQKRVLRLIYIIGWKEYAIALFVNAKILPITLLFHEAVCYLMLGVHNDNASSNIIEISARSSNNHIYTARS